MNKKYKNILLLGILFCSVFLFATKVQAIDLGGDIAHKIASGASYEEEAGDTLALSKRVGKVINIALTMLGVIFLLLTFYAGYLWMFAQGEEEMIGKSKKILTTAVIGILIIVSAYSITSLVVGKLVEKTISDKVSEKEKYGCCLRYIDNKESSPAMIWNGTIVKNKDECMMTGWEVSGCRGGIADCHYDDYDAPEQCAAMADILNEGGVF